MIFFSDSFKNLSMSSSDEDFLPDPESRRIKEPPDRGEASGSRGTKRKFDDTANKQSGLCLHDDSYKGKCFFIFLSDV